MKVKPKSSTVEVFAFFNEKPVQNVKIFLVSNLLDYPLKPEYKGITDEKGVAEILQVNKGRYFLLARRKSKGSKEGTYSLFGYYGGNPLFISRGISREIYLPLVEDRGMVKKFRSDMSSISGRVRYGRTGLEGSYIFAYPDSTGDLRGPVGSYINVSHENGSFAFAVPPGNYYLVARKRLSGNFAGPLGKGDYYGYFPGNPVHIDEREKVELELPVVQVKSRNEPIFQEAGVAVIYGKIVDERGKALSGVHAALYENPELLNRPLYLSKETGADGRFEINVHLPGLYYLGARTGYGHAPGPGELYGRYEGTVDHSIKVKEGDEIGDITITVSKIR